MNTILTILTNTNMKKILIFSLLMTSILCYGQLDSSQTYIKVGIPIPFIDSIQLQAHITTQNLQEPDTGYRRLYFIHGLGGDASSWQQASDACWDPSLNIPEFPARKFRVSRPEYTNSTLTTLNSAANEVNNIIVNQAASDIVSYSMNPQSAFIIAHSQGGMVTRSLIHQYMTSFPIPNFGMPLGGFVTIASPLQGAKILNNRGQIEVMANDACKSLSKGPQSTVGIDIFLKIIGKDLTGNLCNIISYDLLPVFFTDYFDNITNDYMVGANAISVFNQDSSYANYLNMPKVAIYAREPAENILWRTANWLVNNPNTPPPFEANDDWDFYNTTVYPTYINYVSKVNQNQNRLNFLIHMSAYVNPIFNPILYTTTMVGIRYYTNKRNAWQEGVSWFNRANQTWETIIGAREFQHSIDTFYFCYHCDGTSFHLNYMVSHNQQDCLNKNCRTIVPAPFVNLSIVLKENDGIVTTESAQNLPGATSIPPRINMANNPSYKGSSHMQIRNDAYLKESLKKLFDGEYGLFFKTKIVVSN